MLAQQTFDVDTIVRNQEEAKWGRVPNKDGSIRPAVDTGFRQAESTPRTGYVRPERVTRVDLDSDQFHSSEVSQVGEVVEKTPAQVSEWGLIPYGGTSFTALTGVNFVKVDHTAARVRNLGYIQSNIARQKAYEDKFAS
jgi:hypothetical protein